jgi:hypothetical protein
MRSLLARLLALIALGGSLCAGQTTDLRSIHKIYIDKMPNDLDQYLRAEFFKQMGGKIEIVLDEKDAEGILTGVSEEKKGTGAQITGRYLGLHDNAVGSLSMVDKERKSILWADEAGDRSLMFGVFKRGGERKVAQRLVEKLKKAMGR